MGKIAGIIQVQVDGEILRAAGDYTVTFDTPEREAMIGIDGRVHGHAERTRAAMIEGEVSWGDGFDERAFCNKVGATVQVDLPHGRTGILRDAFYAGSAQWKTADGRGQFRFQGSSFEVV